MINDHQVEWLVGIFGLDNAPDFAQVLSRAPRITRLVPRRYLRLGFRYKGRNLVMVISLDTRPRAYGSLPYVRFRFESPHC